MSFEDLCINCMSDKGGMEVCTSCGYKEGNQLMSPLYLPPRTILNGRYLIGNVLGHGGFGVTYLAYDLNLNLKLAIKEYLPHDFATRVQGQTTVSIFSGDLRENYEYGLEKYLDEARTLAKFNEHPCVVKILNYFRENNTAYIVMPYLEGITLNAFLSSKGGRLSFEETMNIMLPVMDVLKEVHLEGILHRDISLENIYITKNGGVKLLDFGAARYSIGEYSRSLSIILKPGYAPPEQYYSKGKQGPWTDVYALGATIYKAVTGVLPPEALERMEEDSLAAPSKLNVDIDEDTENAIMKALEVKAINRFQTVAEFQGCLMPEHNIINEDDILDNKEFPKSIEEIVPEESKLQPLRKLLTKYRLYVASAATLVLFLCASLILLSWRSDGKLLGSIRSKTPLQTSKPIDKADLNGTDTQTSSEPTKSAETQQSAQENTNSKPDETQQPGQESTSSKTDENPPTTAAPDNTNQTGAANNETQTPATPPPPPVEQKITVQNVVGKTSTEAESIIKNLNLRLNIAEKVYSDTVPSGAVISQNPAAGTELSKGSVITLIVSLGSDPVVRFADKGLEAAVREAMGKPNGDILKTEALGLQRLVAVDRSISNLQGIQYFKNLVFLNIGQNNISDISLVGSLTNLTDLFCFTNKISDISVIKKLTNLMALDLTNNPASNISVLANMKSLDALYLHNCGITDISPLARLTNLRYLDITSNPIKDYSPLKNLINTYIDK